MNTGEGFFFFPCEINFKIFKNIHFPGSSFIYVIQTWHKPDNQRLHSAWVLEPSRLEDPPDCSVCSTEHWIHVRSCSHGLPFRPSHPHLSSLRPMCSQGPIPFPCRDTPAPEPALARASQKVAPWRYGCPRAAGLLPLRFSAKAQHRLHVNFSVGS